MRVLKRTLVALVVLAWVYIGFSPRDPISAGPPTMGPETVALSGDAVVISNSEVLAVPTDVEVVGEYLVLVDRRSDHPIHVVRPASGDLVRSLGRSGDGPGEYRALSSVSPIPGSATAFWAYDMAHARLTYVDLADEGALDRPWDARLLTLDTNARVTGVEFASDESVIAAGFFADGRLGSFSPGGEMLRSLGELPRHETPIPASVLQHAYMGTLKAHPDRSRLAIGLRHASWIEIRDADGRMIGTTDLPSDRFEPQFETADSEKGPMMRSDETMRFGYVDIAVTSSRIYGLYSGRTRKAFQNRAAFGQQVHVFDWSGRLLDIIELEQDLIAIAVEGDGSTLYGVIHDPAPAVLSWPLNLDTRLASR